MQWSNELVFALVGAFIVGILVGYILLRLTNATMKKQQKLEAELKTATAKLDEQNKQLEQHFEQSATLLSTLAEDYKKLYSHLATSSQTLLPEAGNRIAFFQASLEDKKQTNDDQPKDYSEGSSGILKS